MQENAAVSRSQCDRKPQLLVGICPQKGIGREIVPCAMLHRILAHARDMAGAPTCRVGAHIDVQAIPALCLPMAAAIDRWHLEMRLGGSDLCKCHYISSAPLL